jgi:beta-lactamase class A
MKQGVSSKWFSKSLFLVTFAFIFGALLSYIFFGYQSTSGETVNLRPIQLGKDGLVNPLLAYTVPENKSELKPLHDAIEKKVNEEIRNGTLTSAGIYFRDLDTARWTGINPDMKFSPASLLKVPVMIAYLKKVEDNPSFLNQRVYYDGSFDDNARQDIKPLKAIEKGSSYSYEDLLRYMVSYSDNNATTLLFNHLDKLSLDQVFNDFEVEAPTSTIDYLSPRSYSHFFRILYNATYVNKKLSQKGLELLALPDFPQGITAGVPEGVIVAQKFGEHEFEDGTKQLHDCGIVYQSKHPYFLCVMTKGKDFTKLADVIRDVSALVYKEVDSLDYAN